MKRSIHSHRDLNAQRQHLFDVRDYGAVSSVSDPGASVKTANLVAITAALAALHSGFGSVYFPASVGDYWTDGPLPSLADGQWLIGDGPKSSRIRMSSTTANCIQIIGVSAGNTISWCGARNLGIIGPSSGTGNGVYVKWATFGVVFDNLHIFGWGNGAWQEDSYTVSWRDCLFHDNVVNGFYGETNINQTLFSRCVAGMNGEAGFKIVGGACNVFECCDAEANGTYGFDLRKCYATLINGGDIESNTTANVYVHWKTNATDKAQSVKVHGANITGGGTTPIGVLIDGGNHTIVEHCVLDNHTTDHIKTTANASRTWIGPNQITGTGTYLNDGSATTSGVDYDATNLWTRTRGKHYFSGEIEIDGALNHDGSTVGFFGVAPAARPIAYNATNVTPDRTFDANATTTDELADILGTLIADLRTMGLVT